MISPKLNPLGILNFTIYPIQERQIGHIKADTLLVLLKEQSDGIRDQMGIERKYVDTSSLLQYSKLIPFPNTE